MLPKQYGKNAIWIPEMWNMLFQVDTFIWDNFSWAEIAIEDNRTCLYDTINGPYYTLHQTWSGNTDNREKRI